MTLCAQFDYVLLQSKNAYFLKLGTLLDIFHAGFSLVCSVCEIATQSE